MSNSYFQFKQFTVYQEGVAMKVTTDACLFGAYVEPGNATRILDIGTGTGLLSLMLAQRTPADIDAVEIDEAAFKQANENFSQSPWADRMCVYQADIYTFNAPNPGKYRLILSNPPFFTNHLKNEKPGKTLARHADALTREQLIASITRLLDKESGQFHIILPLFEMEQFITLAAAAQLIMNSRLSVRNFKTDEVTRVIASFSFHPSAIKEDELYIWEEKEKYSARFMELLRPYYLYL